MKTWLRRIAATVGILLLIALLLPLIAIVALQNDQVRSVAVDYILSEINDDLAGTVTVDDVEGSLLGSAVLKDVRIVDARGNHAAHVHTATIDFRLRPLLTRSLVIEEVAVDGANAIARIYDDDVLNWDLVLDPEPDPTPEEPFDWPVSVEHITLDNVSVAYLDETLPVDESIDGLDSWRRERIDDLDEATDADDLKRRWSQGFDPDILQDLSGPRAPFALWLTDLQAQGDFHMQGFDMVAKLPAISAELQADIFSHALSTTMAELSVFIDESTVSAEIDTIELDRWASAHDVTTGILIPPRSQHHPDDAEAYESVFVDLGRGHLHQPLFSWAAPEAPIDAPLDVEGRLIIDPLDLVLIAEVDREEAPQSVSLSVFLDDYAASAPEYRLAIRADHFSAHHWVTIPELPEFTTSAVALVSGKGFELDEIVADLRLRLLDTVVDEYEAELIYADVDFDGELLRGRQLNALTPYFDLDSTFELDLDGHATFQARTTAEERHAHGLSQLSQYRPERAEMNVDVDAHFDPDLIVDEEPLNALHSLVASATWDVAGLDVEDLGAQHSAGRLDVDLRQLDDHDEFTLAATYEIDAQGQGIRFQDQTLGSFSLRDTGRITASPLVDDPFQIVRRFENDASVTAHNLHTPEARVSRADISMTTTDAERGANRAGLQWRADLSGVRTDDLQIDNLRTSLDGSLRFDGQRSSLTALNANIHTRINGLAAQGSTVDTLNIRLRDTQVVFGSLDTPLRSLSTHLHADASNLASPQVRADTVEDAEAEITVEFGPGEQPMDMLRHIDIVGVAAIARLQAPDVDGSVEAVELRADLRGPFDAPRGKVGANAHSISVLGEDFPRAEAEVSFAGDLRRGTAAAELVRQDGEGYHARAAFSFAPGYDAGQVSDLRLGTHRAEWRSPADATLGWTGARIEAQDFLLEKDDQFIAVDGYFHPDHNQELTLSVDLDLHEVIHDFYLEPLLPDIEGHLETTTELGGTHRRPTVNTEIQLSDFHHEGVGPLSIYGRAEYADQVLSLHRADVEAFDEPLLEAAGRLPLSFDMSGEVEIFTERHSQLRLRIHEQELRRFHRHFPVLNDYGIDGTARLYLDWAGTLEDPRIELNSQLRDFQFRGEVGDDFVDVRNLSLASELEYTSLQRGGPGLQFTADAEWNDDDVFAFHLHSPLQIEDWLVAVAEDGIDALQWNDEFLQVPFDLRMVMPSFDLERLPFEPVDNLGGRVEFDAHFQGPLQNLEGHLELDVDGLGFHQEIGGRLHRISDVDLDLRMLFDDEAVHVETMELSWMDRHISSAEGMIPLPIATIVAGEPLRDLPVDFHWVFHERPVRDFDVINFDLYGHMVGRIGAELRMGGSLRDPSLSARAGIYDTRLGDDSLGSFELRVDAQDNLVEFEGGLTRQETSLLTTEGHVPILLDMVRLSRGEDWQLPGDLHLNVQSDRVELADILPVHLLSNYIVDPEGELTVDVTVGGQWDAPTVDGTAELEDGAITLPEFARRFEDIHTVVAFEPRAFVLEHFEVHDGPSSVHATGTVAHHLLVPGEIDLEAEANEFNLIGIGTDIPVIATGEVHLTGEILGEPGSVEIDIYDLVVELTDEWDRTLHTTHLDPDIVILDAAHRARIAEMVEDDGEVDGLHLRADITIHRGARAFHPLGDVTFDADLTADMIGNIVTIGGSVDVRRGEMEFLGRRFLIQPSEVTFTGEIPPDPRLNIEAHHELERVIVDALGPPASGEPRIVIRISGTATEPRMQLEADPAMSDTEILFVLMTGRPPDRTGVGRDEGVAAQALSAVSGVFLGLLEDELAGNVPVDVLRLEPSVPGARGGRLEVGRYLGPNLFFSWRHQFGADEEVAGNVWRLEYHFLPRWMLEGRYTDRNEGEFNLFWDVF